MRHFGISLYPEHSTKEACTEYMKLAASYGFDRIFTCLLSVKASAEDTIAEFTEFCTTAHDLGFSVAVDTNNEVFDKLGATPYDVEVFHRMGVDIIRLDAHFDEQGDLAITRNPYGIMIEYNASGNLGLDLLIERGADSRNMCTCHNFYPEPYTGLGEDRFTELSWKYKSLGLKVSAFVSSQAPNTFGPWSVFEGLPTLEEDRRRPIDLQVRHLLATDLVDDILIGNAYATEEELKAIAELDKTKTCMTIKLADDLSEAERKALFDFNHVTRGDASDYMLRSSYPRTQFKETSIPARPAPEVFHRGDVLIVNDNMSHYRGEVEVALQDIPNDGTRNLAARIIPEEHFLLDYVLPEYPFGFIG